MSTVLLRVFALALLVVGLLAQATLMTDLVDGRLYGMFDATFQVVGCIWAAILKGHAVPVVALLACCGTAAG